MMNFDGDAPDLSRRSVVNLMELRVATPFKKLQENVAEEDLIRSRATRSTQSRPSVGSSTSMERARSPSPVRGVFSAYRSGDTANHASSFKPSNCAIM